MQNYGTLQQPLLGELAMSQKKKKKKEREKKMPFIVATYVSACSPRAARACTPLGPKFRKKSLRSMLK